MTGAHFHLLLNHVPVTGLILVILLLIIGLLRRSEELVRGSFLLFILVALGGVATYFTGEGAEHVIEELPNFEERFVEAHEEAALFAVILVGVVGAVALAAIAVFRGAHRLPGWVGAIVLVLSLIAAAAAARTAYLGGQIRHPEVRPGESPPVEEPAQQY